MIVEIWHPGTPAVPAIPARYVETSGPGWASGAVSIPITTADGGYKWQVPASVVGVFIGLASKYPGSGYFGIEHALLFSRGSVDIYERGQRLGTLGSYVSGDEFTMFRQAGRVWFLKNGIKEYDRPSLLTGSFRLAATEYLTGDTVVDADTFGVGVAPTSGDGWARLAPLRAIGFETTPSCYGVAELEPLTSQGREDGHAWGTSSLGSLLALGSDRPFGIGRGTMAPLTGYGESGLIKPAFGTGLMTIPPAFTAGRMIPGGVGVGVMTSKLLALGSDRPIAQGVAELSSMFAWGAEALELRGSVMSIRNRYKITASGRRSDVSGVQAVGPALTMQAYGGGSAKLKGPRLTLSAGGTVPAVARMDKVLPALVMAAAGTVSEVAGLAVELPGGFQILAYTGAIARLTTKGAYSVTGAATTTERAEALLNGPGFFGFVANGRREGVARAHLIGPALTPAPSGHAWLVAPHLTMVASGQEEIEVSYESYAINLATGAVTHYVDFPFDQVLRFGNRHFGVRPDGIYELTGDTDDGAPISATVKTFHTDFGATNFKRVPYVYLYGRFEGDMAVGTQVNEGPEYEFPAPAIRGDGVQALRAKIAQGLKGNAWSFTLSNADGASFDIERVEALITTTSKAY